MKKVYTQPEIDVIWLKMEAMICTSGTGEDLHLEDPQNPWATPLFTDFPSLF